MVPATETRIEAFRQTVERLSIITAQLHTLAVTLARADELPALIARTSYPIERKLLAEEQAGIGHPLGLRVRQAQLESELRQGWLVAIKQLRAATDAAADHVTTAAGGTEPPAPSRSPGGTWKNWHGTATCLPPRPPPPASRSCAVRG